MTVEQVIEEGGVEEEHVEADTAAQGDDITAQGDAAQEPSIPSPTPPTPPPQQLQDLSSTSQALETTKLKSRVKKLEKEKKVRVLKLRRLKNVRTSQRIDTSDDTVMDDASNEGRIIDDLDKDDAVALMHDKEEDKKEEESKVVEDDQVQGRQAESQAEIYKIDMDHASKVLITATSTIISAAEPYVPTATITATLVRVAVTSTRRRKGVVIRDPEEESTTSSIIPADTRSKVKGKWMMVEEAKPLKKATTIDHVKQKAKEDIAIQRYQAIKRKPQTEAQARRNMIMYLKNVAGLRLDYFKGMSYDDIRLIFEAKFTSNVDFLLKTKEHMEEEESRALQSINL
nr:hypothetical protein [Tanacetum cinerariifolium]